MRLMNDQDRKTDLPWKQKQGVKALQEYGGKIWTIRARTHPTDTHKNTYIRLIQHKYMIYYIYNICIHMLKIVYTDRFFEANFQGTSSLLSKT